MKIFIASSSRADKLAKRLQYSLEQQSRDFSCDPWSSDTFHPGAYTLDSLVEKCRASDFAIVLLTKDDQNRKKGKAIDTPRDNCIFELGLFLGGLMFDRSRCIVLTSVDEDGRPSDIKGVTLISFTEPDNLEHADNNACDEALKGKVSIIADTIQNHGPLYRGEISLQTLLEMERLDVYQGRLRPKSMVTVKAAEPLELTPKFASFVRENLQGSVKYRYYFPYNPIGLDRIALLVQVLAAAGIPPEITDSKRKEKMMDHKDQVRENLENLRKRVSIDLMPKTGPLSLCVHNASSPIFAACYLRLGNLNFVKACDGEPAHKIASYLMGVNQAPPEKRPVFLKTLDDDLGVPGVIRQLRSEIQELFDESFHKELEDVCFGP